MVRRPNRSFLLVALSTGAALFILSGCVAPTEPPAQYGVTWETFEAKMQGLTGNLAPGSSETRTVRIDWPNMVRVRFSAAGDRESPEAPPGNGRLFEFLITGPGDLGTQQLKYEAGQGEPLVFELNPVPEPASLPVGHPDERIVAAAQQFETNLGRGDWTVQVTLPERPTMGYAQKGTIVWGLAIQPTLYQPVADDR